MGTQLCSLSETGLGNRFWENKEQLQLPCRISASPDSWRHQNPWGAPLAAPNCCAWGRVTPVHPQSTFQLCCRCSGGAFPAWGCPGVSQQCGHSPGLAGHCWSLLSLSQGQQCCCLQAPAYKRTSKHSPATSKNSANVSTGMNSSWKVFRALSAASWIGMSLCLMNSAREKDQPPSVLLVGTFWQGMKTPNQAKKDYLIKKKSYCKPWCLLPLLQDFHPCPLQRTSRRTIPQLQLHHPFLQNETRSQAFSHPHSEPSLEAAVSPCPCLLPHPTTSLECPSFHQQ